MSAMRTSRETMGERMTTHGHTKGSKPSPTYSSWSAMIDRCTNRNSPNFARYGGKGIKICDRWRAFENFLADMGERPERHTLDRYPDGSGNYEPGNCRWATSRQQNLNQSRVRPVVRSDGLRFGSIIEAAEATGSNRRCIREVCAGNQRVHRGFVWRFDE